MAQTTVTFLLVLFISIFIVSFCFVYSDKLKLFFSKFNFKFFNFQKKSTKKYNKSSTKKGSGKNKVKASANQFRPIVKPPEIEYKKTVDENASLVVSENNKQQPKQSINSLEKNLSADINKLAISNKSQVEKSKKEELDKEFEEVRKFLSIPNSSPAISNKDGLPSFSDLFYSGNKSLRENNPNITREVMGSAKSNVGNISNLNNQVSAKDNFERLNNSFNQNYSNRSYNNNVSNFSGRNANLGNGNLNTNNLNSISANQMANQNAFNSKPKDNLVRFSGSVAPNGQTVNTNLNNVDYGNNLKLNAVGAGFDFEKANDELIRRRQQDIFRQTSNLNSNGFGNSKNLKQNSNLGNANLNNANASLGNSNGLQANKSKLNYSIPLEGGITLPKRQETNTKPNGKAYYQAEDYDEISLLPKTKTKLEIEDIDFSKLSPRLKRLVLAGILSRKEFD